MNRRQFLQHVDIVSSAVACSVLPAVLGACAGRLRVVTPALVDGALILARVDIGEAGVLVADPRSDLPIYVRPTVTGGFVAVSTRCTHRGCQVDPMSDRLVCPCHGSEFSFAGARLQGPADRALTRFAVTAEGDSVRIDTSQRSDT